MAGAFQGALAGGGLRSFRDGASMDAAVSVGEVCRLVGATTGAEIALIECVTTGPVTYRPKGRFRWYQATGTEFTGVLKWVAVGAGGAITWGGTPGSRTLGGMKFAGGGTIELQGLELLDNRTGSVTALVYVAAHDTAPATGRGLLAAWTMPGINTNIIGGGFGYTGTSLRGAVAMSQSRDTPTLTLGAGAITATASAEWVIQGNKYLNAANVSAVGVAYTGSTGNTIGTGAVAAPAAGAQSRAALWKVGDIDAYILETSIIGVGTT